MQGLRGGERQSEISTHNSVSRITSFVGVLPTEEAQEEKDDDSSFHSKVDSFPLLLLPPHTRQWDLDMPVPQGSSSLRTGSN